MSKFTAENDVFIEFHHNTCFVKDLRTGVILLQGALDNGLYHIARPQTADNYLSSESKHHALLSVKTEFQNCSPDFPSAQCFVSSATDQYELWHRRLCHASSKVVELVLRKCNIQNIMNENKADFCDVCQYGKSHTLPFQLSQSKSTKPTCPYLSGLMLFTQQVLSYIPSLHLS